MMNGLCFPSSDEHYYVFSLTLTNFHLRRNILVSIVANLSAFRTFVRFVLVWICRFPLPLSVWEGLRFMIPGLFSYLFSLCDCSTSWACSLTFTIL